VAIRAENYLKSTGIADKALFGPEAEFFIFDDVRFDQRENMGFYYIDSAEGSWNSGREERPNLGYKPRYKEGYFPVPPTDSFQDLRSEMMLMLIGLGCEVETQHHEVATAGQAEIDLRFDELTRKICRQKRRETIRENRDVYAKTSVQRQWLGHACTPEPVEG
jgi:glutamine synthetase